MNETAQQIEFLIETVQQDFELKASLLEDVVEGEVLVAEQLESIHGDVVEIRDGLFNFFQAEQARFEIQQNIDKEANFRLLENLRESRGGQIAPPPGVSSGASDDTESPGFGEAFSGAFAGGGFAALAASLGKVANLLVKRIPLIAAIAGTGAAAISFAADLEANLERLQAEGFDFDTALKEAATLSFGELAADFSDIVIEPVSKFGLDLIAKELGYIPEEIEE